MRIFKAVSEAGSFSAAAVALHMSQPAVSQHVAALERELGAVLVDRSTRGVTLTAAGRVAHRHALTMLRTVGEARRELALLDQQGPGLLRVAAFPSAAAALLPPAARVFRDERPGADLELTELDADAAIARVVDGEADLALVFDYAARPLSHRAVAFEHLLDDPLYVAVPGSRPGSRTQPVDLLDLADEEWIGGSAQGCGEVLRAICASAGFTPRIALQSNRYPTTQAMVAAGHGVALIPLLAATPAHPRIRIHPLAPRPPHRRIWAVTPAGRDPDVNVQAMLATLRIVASAQRRHLEP